MRYELASVYLRLKQLDKAEKTVLKGLQQTTGILYDLLPYLHVHVQYVAIYMYMYYIAQFHGSM